MINAKEELILYRIQKAENTLEESNLLAGQNFFNTAVNRLYYACFYSVIALLLHYDISAKTHKGVNILFQKHFISTGLFSEEKGAL